MRVLVACEFSGIVRDAFAAKGHDAWSCDLLDTERPGKHYMCDVVDVLDNGWDMLLAFPPCTYLTNSAAWAYTDGPYHQKVKPTTLVGAARRAAREDAIRFVRMLADAQVDKVVIENPVGVLSTAWRKPDQIIQPWWFGHPESKSTCLWLKGVPPLVPSQMLELPKSGRWANQTMSGQNKLTPSADRWKERSKTYTGIAQAMADQWG